MPKRKCEGKHSNLSFFCTTSRKSGVNMASGAYLGSRETGGGGEGDRQSFAGFLPSPALQSPIVWIVEYIYESLIHTYIGTSNNGGSLLCEEN